MADQQRVLEVFVELADTLVAEFDVIDFMHTLTEASVELIGADAAGLMLVDQRGNLQDVTATSSTARDIETFELEHDEGPCIDCYRQGQPVTNIDPGDAQQRWPRFTEAARTAGFTSIHAVPLRLRDQVIGAMNLYLTRAEALSAPDIALAQGLADMATIGLLQERAVKRTLLAEQLQGALNSRIVIEQAKGALAERLRVPPDHAFEVMRRFSRGTGQTLLTVATRVLDGSLTLRAESLPRPVTR